MYNLAIRMCTSPPLVAPRLKIFKWKFTTPPGIEPQTDIVEEKEPNKNPMTLILRKKMTNHTDWVKRNWVIHLRSWPVKGEGRTSRVETTAMKSSPTWYQGLTVQTNVTRICFLISLIKTILLFAVTLMAWWNVWIWTMIQLNGGYS